MIKGGRIFSRTVIYNIMKKIDVAFKISKDVADMLEARVPKRKRNVFIEEAIRGRFMAAEEEKFLQELCLERKIYSDELDRIDASLELADAMLQEGELLKEDEVMELDDILD